mmetsp:Transcript_134275/g.287183  ORF Transcript_134275/g.287183 Transcript_134275/m.287183 type:complete len:269 (+) Transcript_134275:376-1182(+)
MRTAPGLLADAPACLPVVETSIAVVRQGGRRGHRRRHLRPRSGRASHQVVRTTPDLLVQRPGALCTHSAVRIRRGFGRWCRCGGTTCMVVCAAECLLGKTPPAGAFWVAMDLAIVRLLGGFRRAPPASVIAAPRLLSEAPPMLPVGVPSIAVVQHSLFIGQLGCLFCSRIREGVVARGCRLGAEGKQRGKTQEQESGSAGATAHPHIALAARRHVDQVELPGSVTHKLVGRVLPVASTTGPNVRKHRRLLAATRPATSADRARPCQCP